MKIFSIMLVLFSVGFAPSGHSAWEPQSQRWENEFRSGPVKFQNGDLISIWANANVKKNSISEPEFSPVNVESSLFETGSIEVLVNARDRSAPLVVYLPGIFGEARSDFGYRAINWFSSRGYHVAVIPNSWSSHYLSRKPKFNPGNMEMEATVVRTAIAKAISVIGSYRVSGTEIYAESYGAFLSSVVAAQDFASSRPLVTGSYTLVSPPVDMAYAIQNLDRAIDDTQNGYEARCLGEGKRIYRYFAEMIVAGSDFLVSDELERCAKSIFAQSLQDLIAGAIEKISIQRGLGVTPGRDRPEYSEWKKNVRFESVFKVLKLPQGAQSKIFYWLGQLDVVARRKIRVITANDDILNLRQTWCSTDGAGILSNENLILLPWGGHIGFTELPEFRELLSINFPQK